MPRYLINLRTESHIAESISVEKDDQTALRVEVAKFVGETLREHALQIWADEDWRVDVTDQRGLILFVLQVTAYDAAASRATSR
jgi:hypothetical protein